MRKAGDPTIEVGEQIVLIGYLRDRAQPELCARLLLGTPSIYKESTLRQYEINLKNTMQAMSGVWKGRVKAIPVIPTPKRRGTPKMLSQPPVHVRILHRAKSRRCGEPLEGLTTRSLRGVESGLLGFRPTNCRGSRHRRVCCSQTPRSNTLIGERLRQAAAHSHAATRSSLQILPQLSSRRKTIADEMNSPPKSFCSGYRRHH